MNDRLFALDAKEKSRILAVLRELSKLFAPIADDVVLLCEGIAAFDAAYARAQASVMFDCVNVSFSESTNDDDDAGKQAIINEVLDILSRL